MGNFLADPNDLQNNKSHTLSVAHEETIFNFTDQNIDLQTLSQKIVEFLKESWPKVEVSRNEVMNGYEIIAINDGVVQKSFVELKNYSS